MKDLAQVDYIKIEDRIKGTVSSGFGDIDKHVQGLKQSEITIIFGRNGEGKSTFASQLIAHHINEGHKAYLFSGELSENKIQEWLYKQVVGGDTRHYRTVKTKFGIVSELKQQVINLVKRWHKERLFIYDTKVDIIKRDTKRLFEDMLDAKRRGVNLFVIDNLMTAFVMNDSSINSDQSNFVQACKDFARNNKVHVVLIAHPNKSQTELTIDATSGNLQKNDVSGSGNISNKADNMISIERLWKQKGVEYDDSIPDAFVTSLKDRQDGQRATFKYWFSHHTLRFYNNTTDMTANYDWEGNGKQSGLPF